MFDSRDVRTVRGEEALALAKAISHESRLAILELLADGDRNITEICQALEITQPTATRFVQQLEQVGLIVSEYMPGQQGLQKRCRLANGRVEFSFRSTVIPSDSAVEVSMPVGLYTQAEARVPCGLASRDGFIGYMDQPQAFFEPDRGKAQILWMAGGFLEYVFPCQLPTTVTIDRLEILMEICSEAPAYNEDWPSDITLWVNGVEIGTWTSPGDFGSKRGVQNPEWWISQMTQHGLLKRWSVSHEGAQIDGQRISDVVIGQTNLVPGQPITVRIGVKPDARHQGGFNLFGAGFGNYAHDLILRLICSPSP